MGGDNRGDDTHGPPVSQAEGDRIMAKKPVEFSARLAELRKAAELSQAVVAERAGLVQATISHLERGAKRPEWDTVCALADALGVSVEAFRRSA